MVARPTNKFLTAIGQFNDRQSQVVSADQQRKYKHRRHVATAVGAVAQIGAADAGPVVADVAIRFLHGYTTARFNIYNQKKKRNILIIDDEDFIWLNYLRR